MSTTDAPSPKRQKRKHPPTPHSHSRSRSRTPQAPRPNIYAASAGHVTGRGAARPHAPADVLFTHYAAPDRFAEPQLDWYGAHRWLDARTRLRGDVYDETCLADGSYAGDAFTGARRAESSAGDSSAAAGGSSSKRGRPREPGSKRVRVPDVRLRRGTEVSGAGVRRAQSGLPESDLCKALHRYVSGFYAVLEAREAEDEERSAAAGGAADANRSERMKRRRERRRVRVSSFRSLDETAMLGLAILLEETARIAVCGDGGGGEGWRSLVTAVSDQGADVLSRPRLAEDISDASSSNNSSETDESDESYDDDDDDSNGSNDEDDTSGESNEDNENIDGEDEEAMHTSSDGIASADGLQTDDEPEEEPSEAGLSSSEDHSSTSSK